MVATANGHTPPHPPIRHGHHMTTPDDAVYLNATRIWLEKAVIGLNLCPFAKAPYRKGRVRLVVSHARHLDAFLEQLDDELQRLAATPIDDNDLVGVLQIAPFHPQFQFADTAADDVSNNTNRSPYPTLHLIRESSIDKAVASIPDPAVIYERNIALLRQMGAAGWAELGMPSAPKSGEPS